MRVYWINLVPNIIHLVNKTFIVITYKFIPVNKKQTESLRRYNSLAKEEEKMTTPTPPNSMAGIQIERTGGPEVLKYETDIPFPQPGQDEVLIKVDYVGVNYIDT